MLGGAVRGHANLRRKNPVRFEVGFFIKGKEAH
jgi:hypothetical protein